MNGGAPGIDLQSYDKPLDLSKRCHDQSLIKQSLKSLIKARRLAEGKDLPSISFVKSEPAYYELTEEEITKQLDRKEQNRKAAHKCRQKKKRKLELLLMEKNKLKNRKRQLLETLEKLEKEKQDLLKSIRQDNTEQNQASVHNIKQGPNEDDVQCKNCDETLCLCHQNDHLMITREIGSICESTNENKLTGSGSIDQKYENYGSCSTSLTKTQNIINEVKSEYYDDYSDMSSDSEGMLVIYESDSSDF